MRLGGGKEKGSEQERVIAKKLSLWVSAGTRDDLIWRSSLSGGRTTVAFRKGKENRTQSGDLCSIDPLSSVFLDKFYVECKFYKDLQIASAFLKEMGLFYSFWNDLRPKARRLRKFPMLVAKENFSPVFVVLTESGREALGLWNHTAAIFADQSAHIYLFDSFVQHAVPPKED